MRFPTLILQPAMLITLALLVCLGCVNGEECESKQFMSHLFGKCINCSECQHPDTIIRPCEGTRDTLCGPPSMLKLDWSWMKHDTDHAEPLKEMTETFQENMQEIKLHEQHVKKMQKLLLKNGKKEESQDNYDVDSQQDLWDHLKALGRFKDKTPEIATDLVHKLQTPKVLSEDPKIFEIPFETVPHKSMHFNSQEASDLLKSASISDEEDDWSPVDDHHLKFNHDLLVKKFGFFPMDDDDDDDDDDDEEDDLEDGSETEKPFSFSEKVVLDYQTAVAVFAVTTIVVFFLALLCYCFRVTKGSLAYPDDLGDLQFWKQNPQQLSTKPVPSTIYKTTTEVIGKESSGNYKYLERIINKAVKKSRVPSKIYRAAHPSMETRPLTADCQAFVHTPKSKFQDSFQTV